MEKTEKTKTTLPMTCVCRDEGKEAAAEIKAKALKIMGAEEADDLSAWVTWCIHQLNWEYNTYITMMASDMWCGIQAESPTERIYIECDRIEDGLAEIIVYLQEQKDNASETVS
jgi:hypothetical protein